MVVVVVLQSGFLILPSHHISRLTLSFDQPLFLSLFLSPSVPNSSQVDSIHSNSFISFISILHSVRSLQFCLKNTHIPFQSPSAIADITAPPGATSSLCWIDSLELIRLTSGLHVYITTSA